MCASTVILVLGFRVRPSPPAGFGLIAVSSMNELRYHYKAAFEHRGDLPNVADLKPKPQNLNPKWEGKNTKP